MKHSERLNSLLSQGSAPMRELADAAEALRAELGAEPEGAAKTWAELVLAKAELTLALRPSFSGSAVLCEVRSPHGGQFVTRLGEASFWSVSCGYWIRNITQPGELL